MSQSAQNARLIAALQGNTFNVIKVRFRLSGVTDSSLLTAGYSQKSYSYKIPNDVFIKVNDEVVVDSPKGGLIIATVDEIVGNVRNSKEFLESTGFKWVVQKVYTKPYFERMEKEAEALKILEENTPDPFTDVREGMIKRFGDKLTGKICKALGLEKSDGGC